MNRPGYNPDRWQRWHQYRWRRDFWLSTTDLDAPLKAREHFDRAQQMLRDFPNVTRVLIVEYVDDNTDETVDVAYVYPDGTIEDLRLGG